VGIPYRFSLNISFLLIIHSMDNQAPKKVIIYEKQYIYALPLIISVVYAGFAFCRSKYPLTVSAYAARHCSALAVYYYTAAFSGHKFSPS
jgi:hypothetical protein